MKKYLLILLLLIGFLFVFLCYNAHQSEVIFPSETTSATEFVIETTAEPTVETTVPYTERDTTLPFDAGSCLLRFEDNTTEDYMDYYLFIPENATTDMPLVIFLHGDGEVGKPEALFNYSMIKQARIIYGEEFPFIAISPCTRITSWTKGSIPETLKDLIDHVAQMCSVDIDRICITGHSRGAIGVWNMISTYGDYFSSAVIISSISAGELNIENCAKVPILAFAGTDDDLELQCQNAMKRYINKISKLSDNASFVLLKRSTHGETKDKAFTKETFEWLLAQ